MIRGMGDGARAWVLALATASGACVFGQVPPRVETLEDFHAEPTQPMPELVEWVGNALSDVPLKEAQTERLRSIARALEARHRPAQAARARFADALGAQVTQGRVDAVALEPFVEAWAKAAAEVAKDDRRAVDDLYAVLDGSQRGALADALWPRIEKNGSIDDLRGRYALWRRELDLTPEEDAVVRAHVEAALAGEDGAALRAEHEAIKARLARALDAFRGASFEAQAFADAVPTGDRVKARAGRLIRFFEVVTGDLTPAQRSRAAEVLRTRAGMRGGKNG